jgi:hypothetical protein
LEEKLLTAKIAKKIREGRKANQLSLLFFAAFADFLCDLCSYRLFLLLTISRPVFLPTRA